MYKYYTPTPETLEEAKSLYRKLARQYHPDFGGDEETMKALNAEYAQFTADFARTNARRRQTEAHKEGRKSAADFHDLDGLNEEIKQTIEAILNNCPGVELEIMGLWLWATGNTKPHKETLKANGFKWAPKKEGQPWFKAFVPSRNREKRTLDEIREMHGTTRVSNGKRDDEAERKSIKSFEHAQGV